MSEKRRNLRLAWLIPLIMVVISGCVEIEPSPDPGVLRVQLEHNPADSIIHIGSRDFSFGNNDLFLISVYQGRAHSDSAFFVLYETPTTYFAGENMYNILGRDTSDALQTVTIFESYLPPGEYTSVEFGMSPEALLLSEGYAVGGLFIPIEEAPGSSPLVSLELDYEIVENDTTNILVRLSSFQSVVRYRDIFHFAPEIETILSTAVGS